MFFLYVPMVFLGFSHGFGGFFPIDHPSSGWGAPHTGQCHHAEDWWPAEWLGMAGPWLGGTMAGFYGLGLGFFVGLADMAGWWWLEPWIFLTFQILGISWSQVTFISFTNQTWKKTLPIWIRRGADSERKYSPGPGCDFRRWGSIARQVLGPNSNGFWYDTQMTT